MGYAALALAITGFALGVRFRIKVLLPILLALLLARSSFRSRAASRSLMVLTVFFAQAIVQSAYFIGLVARGVFARIQRQRRSNGNRGVQRIDEEIDGDASVEAAQPRGVD
jgi:hypothetical protein